MEKDKNNNGTKEHFILARTAFGKQSCVKLERNGRGTWLQVGKKLDEERWDWRRAKLSDTEIAEMLLVFDGRQEQANWLHTFQGSETRISAGRKDQTVFIRVDDYAAALSPGQQVLFAHLCSRIIEKGCEHKSMGGEPGDRFR